MAFDFPRRDPSSLFFPTVHVHDGAVHEEASFDHHLYCQLADVSEVASWESSAGPLGGFVDVERAAGLVDGDAYCFRRQLVGVLPNRDQTLALA